MGLAIISYVQRLLAFNHLLFMRVLSWPEDSGTVQLDCSLPFAKKLFSDLNSVTAFNY